MATPNYGLPIYTGSEQYSLKTVANQITNATDDALEIVARGGVPRVANTSERNSLFPSPSQGDSVYRKNVGWEEVYYETYNATTNPGGASSAGWYPISGKLPNANLYRFNSGAATTSPAAWAFSNFSGYQMGVTGSSVTINQAGRYQFTASLVAGNGGTAQVYGEIRSNDTAVLTGVGAAHQNGANDFNSFTVSGTATLAAGTNLKFYVYSSTALTTGNYRSQMDVQYIGPA